jgi:hypothetical protein
LAAVSDDGAKRYPLDRLGDQIQAVVLNVGIQDAQHVGVLARLPYPGLLQETVFQELASVEVDRSEGNLVHQARTISVLGIDGVV